MGLLTTYGSANRVVEQTLDVKYSKTRISGNWSWESISLSGSWYYMWECHRYATKQFKYVGMTKSAAETCAAALKTALTRTIRVSIWDGSVNGGAWTRVNGGTVRMSDVVVRQTVGNMYEVDVSVNEDDVMLAKIDDNPNPSAQFATEDARAYDV